MTLKVNRRVVIGSSSSWPNPKADGDVLAEIARRFPDAPWDSFSGGVNHCLMMLPTNTLDANIKCFEQLSHSLGLRHYN